ncbi:hypothetical protein Taro_037500 [Colocasia esculenta]|uniref:Uncharacterized protein n=1 Tax=Colocasia esculenta TaxID=4460 RepID=A0A843WPY0_COLES|nr:hypothetical protein [Colocasia esculenta]
MVSSPTICSFPPFPFTSPKVSLFVVGKALRSASAALRTVRVGLELEMSSSLTFELGTLDWERDDAIPYIHVHVVQCLWVVLRIIVKLRICLSS